MDVGTLEILVIVMAVTDAMIVKIVMYAVNVKIVIKCLIVINVNNAHSVMVSTHVASVIDANNVLWVLAVKIV